MELAAKLRELDSLGWESPSGFDNDDYQSALRRIDKLKPEMERVIRHRMTLDTSIQDASHFAELAWFDGRYYRPRVGGALIANIAVRFSNFDFMATVYSGNGDEKALMKFETQIGVLLTKHGFHYVPHKVLLEPYPGNELRRGRAWKDRNWQDWTWFTRFFDHI